MNIASKEIAVLEICSNCYNFLIGYVYNNEIYIIYSKTFYKTNGLSFKNGDIDVSKKSEIIKEINSILAYSDKEFNFSWTINDVVLVYPPYGIEIFKVSKQTNTVSQNSLVDKIDVENVFSLVKKEKIPNPNSKIADIFPLSFGIENGKRYRNAPLNEVSRYLSIDALIFTLPKSKIDNLNELITDSKRNVVKGVIAPVGSSFYLKTHGYDSMYYFLVDIGYKTTFVTLIGENKVVKSSFFDYGFSDLVNKVSQVFKVNLNLAKNLVNEYGYSKSVSSFNPPIVVNTLEGGIKEEYNVLHLDNIIIDYFKSFNTYLVNVAETLVGKNNIGLLPTIQFLFYNDLSELKGFDSAIKESGFQYNFKVSKLNIVGIDNNRFLNVIGALSYVAFYNTAIDVKSFRNKINIERNASEQGEKEEE